MALSFQYHSGLRLSYVLLRDFLDLGGVAVERGGRWMFPLGDAMKDVLVFLSGKYFIVEVISLLA